MLRYLTIAKFSAESGYTEYAIRSKIHRGDWLQDVVWIKAPDNRILIDIEGYQAWVERAVASDPHRIAASRSTSTIEARAAANG